jgi:hypothetical protein
MGEQVSKIEDGGVLDIRYVIRCCGKVFSIHCCMPCHQLSLSLSLSLSPHTHTHTHNIYTCAHTTLSPATVA